MPFCIASNWKSKRPLEKLVSPKGARLGRIEKVVMMATSVQKLCKDKGISLLSLAERSALDLKRLESIYLGRWTPSPNERERIAQALGTSSNEIAWEHSTPIEHFYGPG